MGADLPSPLQELSAGGLPSGNGTDALLGPLNGVKEALDAALYEGELPSGNLTGHLPQGVADFLAQLPPDVQKIVTAVTSISPSGNWTDMLGAVADFLDQLPPEAIHDFAAQVRALPSGNWTEQLLSTVANYMDQLPPEAIHELALQVRALPLGEWADRLLGGAADVLDELAPEATHELAAAIRRLPLFIRELLPSSPPLGTVADYLDQLPPDAIHSKVAKIRQVPLGAMAGAPLRGVADLLDKIPPDAVHELAAALRELALRNGTDHLSKLTHILDQLGPAIREMRGSSNVTDLLPGSLAESLDTPHDTDQSSQLRAQTGPPMIFPVEAVQPIA